MKKPDIDTSALLNYGKVENFFNWDFNADSKYYKSEKQDKIAHDSIRLGAAELLEILSKEAAFTQSSNTKTDLLALNLGIEFPCGSNELPQIEVTFSALRAIRYLSACAADEFCIFLGRDHWMLRIKLRHLKRLRTSLDRYIKAIERFDVAIKEMDRSAIVTNGDMDEAIKKLKKQYLPHSIRTV